MIRILLVDDEPLALDRLRVALRGIRDAELVGTACDGVEALRLARALSPDLIILDIQMPGHTGLEVAQALETDISPPEVVFVTAFDRFATDAFAVDAADYLLKPVNFGRLRGAVERARRRRAMRDAQSRADELQAVVTALRADSAGTARAVPASGGAFEDAIWVPMKGGSVRVPVDTIETVEAARDYVMLNTSLRSYILRATMNDIERMLDPALLLRIHRSHIVRIAGVEKVQQLGRGMMRLVMRDESVLPVGPNHVEAVARALGL